jgi:hypothetical protein
MTDALQTGEVVATWRRRVARNRDRKCADARSGTGVLLRPWCPTARIDRSVDPRPEVPFVDAAAVLVAGTHRDDVVDTVPVA